MDSISKYFKEVTNVYVKKAPNSNAWSSTIEFWISGGKVWIEYNGMDKPSLLVDVLRSSRYKDIKDILEDIAQEVIMNFHKYPMVNVKQSWERVLLQFIQMYLYKKDDKLDVVIKSNGDIIFNLEEKLNVLKPYKSVYGEEIKEDCDDELEEAIKRKKVVRGGKRIIRYYTDNPNKKIVTKDGRRKEVAKTSSEKRNRKRAAKKSAKKKKGQSKQIARKRNRSLKKRTW